MTTPHRAAPRRTGKAWLGRPAALAVGLGVGLGVGVGAAPGFAQDAPRDQRLAFRLDWGPAALARIDMRIVEDGAPGARRRVAEATGEAAGLAGVFTDFTLNQRGETLPDGSRRYDATTDFGDDRATRSVRWAGPGARPEVLDAGPPPDRPLTPIPPGELERTTDPSSAALALLDQVAAGKGCDATFRLFDGVRRLDMTVVDEGEDMLKRDRDWTYDGPAHRCRIKFKRVGGFPVTQDAPAEGGAAGSGRDGPSGRQEAGGPDISGALWPREVQESDYDRLLWLAELPAGMSPVRLRVEWPLGYVTARIDLGE